MKLATMRRLALILALALPANAGRSFNGSTDVVTANGIGSALDISSGPETISLWWYPTSVSVTQAAVAHYRAFTSGSQFAIGLGYGSASNNNFTAVFGCCGISGPAYLSCGTVTTNQWYQIVVRLDSVGGFAYLNVSGGLTCSVSTTTTLLSRAPGSSNFTIGDDSTGSYGAHGIIGEVAVWNLLLSTNQLASLRNICPVGPSARRMGFPPPVGYFPLTGASGSSIEPDLSGNVLNGTLTGTSPANHPPCTP